MPLSAAFVPNASGTKLQFQKNLSPAIHNLLGSGAPLISATDKH